MVKKIFALLVCFIGLTIFISILNCQGSMNTITLPNGEVVWDLNGEWDVLVEPYGPWISIDSYKEICKITQEGSSFVGVRMIDDSIIQKVVKVYEVSSIKVVLRMSSILTTRGAL